jgi:Putative adhesin
MIPTRMMVLPGRRFIPGLAAAALCASIAPAAQTLAADGFRASHSAEPDGTVEVVGIAGSIEIDGWDRSEVDVAAPNDLGERVRLTGDGGKTVIHIRPDIGGEHEEKGEARVVIHVPAKSEVKVTLVSANLKVQGLQGETNLRTVSGNITGEVAGDLRANTATGYVHLAARGAKSTEVKTINGDVELKGGSGDVEVQTVSGNAKLDLATLTRGRFHTISGNLTAHLSLAADGDLDGESVSGSVRLDFSTAPSADFDVQTFSGSIDNCFGPKAEQTHYGPGSRLEFRNGKGQARVRIETKSGDVHLCTGAAHGEGAGATSHDSGAAVVSGRRPPGVGAISCV